MKSHWKAGDFNLKGRKEMRLGCNCCIVRDLRSKYWNREAEKEVQSADND